MNFATALCSFILVIVLLSCNNNPSTADAAVPVQVLAEDLKKVYCPVDLGSAESDITNNRTFLFAHHLSPNLDDYPAQPNWQQIDSIYQNTSFDTLTNPEKTVLQQVASILILRNHALLAQPAEKEKITYYTKMYVESGGKSAGLLYYSLAALGDSLASAQKSAYINTVTNRSSKVVTDIKNWMKTTKETLKDQDFPEEVKASLKTDFANLENIVKNEQEFARKLQKMMP